MQNIGAVIGHFCCARCNRAAVGIVGDSVLVRRPLGIDRLACCESPFPRSDIVRYCSGGDARGGGHLIARAASSVIPAAEAVACAGGNVQSIGAVIGHFCRTRCNRAAVGIVGDSVLLRRPFGV